MRGGPSLKGKGGLVGFRRSLKVKEVLVVFRMLRKYWWFFEKPP